MVDNGCPTDLEPYIEAYKRKQEIHDYQSYMNGRYVLDALMATVGNMFKDKNDEPYSYPTRPYGYDEQEQKPMTEEEKNQQIDNLFLSLQIMQGNFERTYGKSRKLNNE